MIRQIHLTLLLILLLIAATFARDSSQHEKQIANLFDQREIIGTIIITTLSGDTTITYNPERAKQQFLPASTFKIPNTLIALQIGAIKDENEVIPWDGVKRFVPEWNQDQTLASAFPISCVWFYQELAKRIGNENYLKYLQLIDYGNHLTGDDVTTIWLAGDLRISAAQQIEFLRKLYIEKMPFDERNYRILKRIMIVDETPEYTLRAKTGWSARVEHQIGWYVGYVETRDNVWLFALNIDINDKSDLAYRRGITLEALRLLNIIPTDERK